MTQSGRFRDPITFERLDDVVDTYGNPSTGWAAVPDVLTFADIRESPGKERLAAGRLEAPRTATMRVRSDPGTQSITAADRILARSDTWNIRSITQVDAAGRIIEFLCEAGGEI